MKPRVHGHTIVEMLVSTAVLAGIMLVVVQSLGMTQRAVSHVTRQAAASVLIIDASQILTQVTRDIVLEERASYAADGITLTTTSDGHFICGPVRELLPKVDDAIGDAMFYQRRNAEGQLECGGFFVRLTSDELTRPAYLRAHLPPRRRFCLIQWQQPTTLNALHHLDAALKPLLTSITNRDELYRWFREGILKEEQCHVIAEHVLMMRLLPNPITTCHDTRRHQWEGLTPAALASQHRLPVRLTIQLLSTTEAFWERAGAMESNVLSAWLALVETSQDVTQLQPQAHSRLHLPVECTSLSLNLGSMP